MSFLRIRSPYHEPRDIPLGPSVGRRTQSRLGIRGGSGNPVLVGALVTGSSKYSGRVDKRVGQHSPKVRRFVDLSPRKNPDDGGVKPATTEVRS